MLFLALLSAIIKIIARRPKGGIKMRNYEIMYILRADLDEAGRAAEMEKLHKLLTDNGAEVKKVDESMGLRDLATKSKMKPKVSMSSSKCPQTIKHCMNSIVKFVTILVCYVI